MTLEGDDAVNLFSLTKAEIDSLGDKQMIKSIYGLKRISKEIFASLIIVVIISITRYYLK
jgi:hypothetical protein